MGLDMYLTAERYLWSYPEDGADAQIAKAIKDMLPELADIDTAKVKTVTADVGYWRKANHIHNWFVKNVQDGVDECEEFYVTYEQLITLRDTCNRVLGDSSLAETLLPTSSGFFFGTTDYDEWYYKDLGDTVKICNDVLNHLFTKTTKEFNVYSQWEIKYRSSW